MRLRPSGILLLVAGAFAHLPLAAQSPTTMMGAPYNDASRAFLDVMIPHHEMAILMSRMAIGAARSDTVRSLARNMVMKQTREMNQLRDARRALFGSDSSRPSMMRDMMSMHEMRDTSMRAPRDTVPHPMMDTLQMRHRPTMRRQPPGGMVATMRGDFDRMFLQHMLAHHLDGADIAILAERSDAVEQVKRLAREVRLSQEQDVAAMRRLLATMPAPR